MLLSTEGRPLLENGEHLVWVFQVDVAFEGKEGKRVYYRDSSIPGTRTLVAVEVELERGFLKWWGEGDGSLACRRVQVGPEPGWRSRP